VSVSTDSPPASPRSWRHTVSALALVGILLAQIVPPTVQLLKPKPQRFGWQMFSAFNPIPQYELIMPDGQIVPVDLHQHVGAWRNEADYARYLPAHLQRVYPQARGIRVRWPDRPGVEVIPCDPSPP
jgi:hypothetical protein